MINIYKKITDQSGRTADNNKKGQRRDPNKYKKTNLKPRTVYLVEIKKQL